MDGGRGPAQSPGEKTFVQIKGRTESTLARSCGKESDLRPDLFAGERSVFSLKI